MTLRSLNIRVTTIAGSTTPNDDFEIRISTYGRNVRHSDLESIIEMIREQQNVLAKEDQPQ